MRRPHDTSMRTQVKRRVVFALAMGIVTTGLISFVLLAVNLGFSKDFTGRWLRSWGIGYAILVPVMLTIGPRLKDRIDRLFE